MKYLIFGVFFLAGCGLHVRIIDAKLATIGALDVAEPDKFKLETKAKPAEKTSLKEDVFGKEDRKDTVEK